MVGLFLLWPDNHHLLTTRLGIKTNFGPSMSMRISISRVSVLKLHLQSLLILFMTEKPLSHEAFDSGYKLVRWIYIVISDSILLAHTLPDS